MFVDCWRLLHGNQILAKIGKKSHKNGHNFSCMRHSNAEFGFWATVSKTVRPMLSDRCTVCLSACPLLSCLSQSVTFVYCGQTVERIKMKLGMQVGRSRPWPHCVRWGSSYPSPKGHSPQFSAHICRGQMAAWIKMPLGMELGLGPGDLYRDPAPLPKNGRSPKFSAHVYWGQTAGWIKIQDGTWHGGRP